MPETTETFYLLVCRECGNGDLVMPFGSPAERGKWAAGHTRETGHDWMFVTESAGRLSGEQLAGMLARHDAALRGLAAPPDPVAGELRQLAADLLELHEAGALAGVRAVVAERLRQVRGEGAHRVDGRAYQAATLAGEIDRGGAAVTDLTARIAELAALIATRLDEDEAVAKVAAGRDGNWAAEIPGLGTAWAVRRVSAPGRYIAGAMKGDIAGHVARNDPDRRLRGVKATRDLVAEILAKPHDYNEGDSWYSCAQAVAHGEDGEPGSGCADDNRAGGPCDCGRDATVARRLGIIATEWEG